MRILPLPGDPDPYRRFMPLLLGAVGIALMVVAVSVWTGIPVSELSADSNAFPVAVFTGGGILLLAGGFHSRLVSAEFLGNKLGFQAYQAADSAVARNATLPTNPAEAAKVKAELVGDTMARYTALKSTTDQDELRSKATRFNLTEQDIKLLREQPIAPVTVWDKLVKGVVDERGARLPVTNPRRSLEQRGDLEPDV